MCVIAVVCHIIIVCEMLYILSVLEATCPGRQSK
jgi:hypothetical protein